ncbi:MAG TPA: NAD(P)-dependent oxidoreductase [Pyrinomonadaceae bacterium]
MAHERVLIAGVEGLLGRYFTAQFLGQCSVTALSHASLDITDAEAVEATCALERPALIVNCAVLGVDACERDPAQARAVNVEGPRNLAACAAAIGADLVHFSSNYVFAGDRPDELPYTVADRPHPINRYGESKLAGENAVRDACTRNFIIRSSWIFGQGKAGFVNETRRRLLAREPIQAITDVRANTTCAADLVLRTLEVIRQGTYGTYHLVNAGVCSYYDIALEIGRLVGLSNAERERLVGGSSAPAASWIAPRPLYTPLRCLTSEQVGLAPMRHWSAALADYLHDG